MAWSVEQNEIFNIWCGRVPASVLASFVNKSECAVYQKASRDGVSASFFGGGMKSLSVKSKVEEMISSGMYSNVDITRMLGLKKNYVANIKRRMKSKTIKNKAECKTKNLDLVKKVFS